MKRFTVQVLAFAAVLVAGQRLASGVDAASALGRLVETVTAHPVRVALAMALAISAWSLRSKPTPERRPDDPPEGADAPAASPLGDGIAGVDRYDARLVRGGGR